MAVISCRWDKIVSGMKAFIVNLILFYSINEILITKRDVRRVSVCFVFRDDWLVCLG